MPDADDAPKGLHASELFFTPPLRIRCRKTSKLAVAAADGSATPLSSAETVEIETYAGLLQFIEGVAVGAFTVGKQTPPLDHQLWLYLVKAVGCLAPKAKRTSRQRREDGSGWTGP